MGARCQDNKCPQAQETRRPLADQKGSPLTEHPESVPCDDDTQQFVINIPCRLAERALKYGNEHGNTITGVVIEALDALLGGRTWS